MLSFFFKAIISLYYVCKIDTKNLLAKINYHKKQIFEIVECLKIPTLIQILVLQVDLSELAFLNKFFI